MTERTNEELVSEAFRLRLLCAKSEQPMEVELQAQGLEAEILRRLREMPDGERIEGWADKDALQWAKGQNPPVDRYFILRMFRRQGVKDYPATLFLHPQEPTDG